MKRNIDLTENRMFRYKNSFNGLDGLMRAVHGLPWDRKLIPINDDSDLDLGHQKESIIALGDKNTRAKIKLYREMDSDKYCDCCGCRITPWENIYRLCSKCNDSLEGYVYSDKCKWRKSQKEDLIVRNILEF